MAGVIQRSFAGGELAPALAARADQAKYLTGLRRCRNFIVQRHGGVTNRPGLRYVGSCKTTSIVVALMRYVSEVAGQSCLLEIGNGYIRFFQNSAAVNVDLLDVDPWDIGTNYVIGDLVQQAGVVYYAKVANLAVAPPSAGTWYPLTGTILEIPNPFGANIPKWKQSGRIITLTHRSGKPYELEFVALTRWILRPVTTSSDVVAPTGLSYIPGGGAGTRTYGYVVTAAAPDTYEESGPSNQSVNSGIGNPTPDAPNVLTWTPVAGSPEYYVYADPYGNGTFGYIGTATGAATFSDSDIPPDYSITPPVQRVLFNTTDNYPETAAYFQQRRFFANTNEEPDAIFGSRVAFPSNFSVSTPLQDDDALTFRVAGNNHNPVRHLVALKQLIVLTDAGEWTIGNGQDPLTPSNLDADQQLYVGTAAPVPVVIGNAIIYVQARGTIVRDVQFDIQVEGLAGRDLSIFAAHLFDNNQVTEIDYAQTPHSVVWAVRDDGALLGLTYIREQDVWGWHRHDTGASGRIEHVCVVPEAGEDAVYVIVRRTIGGAFKRYIERFASRQIISFDRDCFFVDSGLTYQGAPVSTISGLGHLEGEVIAVVGDGLVQFNGDPDSADAAAFTVTGGLVHLPVAASTIHAGLPIRHAEIETLDLDVNGQEIRSRYKKVESLVVLVDASARTFLAGPNASRLVPYVIKPYEDTTAKAFTGQADIGVPAAFNDNGRIFIRHVDPLPLTILGVVPNLQLGG